MDDTEIRQLVKLLDTSKSDDAAKAWRRLRSLGAALVPYFSELYETGLSDPRKRSHGRRAAVSAATKHARTNDAAFQLGIRALRDRSPLVRERACALLAYSLRREALPHLRAALEEADRKTARDVRAAIDAIEHENHNYYIDRQHTGRATWEVCV